MPNRLLSYTEQIFALRDIWAMIRLYWWPLSELMLLRAHRIFHDSFWKKWYFQVWCSTQLCIPVLNILHQESREAKTLPTRSKGLNIDGVWNWCHTLHTAFSLGCFWGVLHPPIVQIYPPISVSEAAAPPTRVMTCKADLYSLIITKQLYTFKYTAIDCTIVMLTEDRG